MAKASPIKSSFNAGEWSSLMEGHINLERWPDSCLLLQDLIPLKQGPITRRGGTKFVKEVKTSANNTALIPFEFNVTQAYQIEVGDAYFRFYRNNAAIVEAAKTITGATQANPVVITTSAAHGYSNGDEVYISDVGGMTELNGKYYRINNVASTTFELQTVDLNNVDGSGFTAYTFGGQSEKVYEVTGPYAEGDLFDSDEQYNFQYAQSADVLYIMHGSYEPRSLSRTGHTSWTVNTLDLNDGPYLPINTGTTTLTLSGTSGSVTVTASATTDINGGDGFKSTDVGRLIRWEDPANNWTWLEITAFTSTTQVTATIKGPNASAGTATTDWRLGVYSDTTGWPRIVTFFQDRILLAGASSYPDRYDLSRTGGYSDTELLFAPSDADGTVTDDAAITGTLQSGEVNSIQWASSDDKGLVIGTAAKEWIIRSSANGEVLTPTNSKADSFSSIGSSYVQPIQAENGTVFMQRARRKVMDVIYNFERDQLKPRDITLPSEHIAATGISQLQHQQEPINFIWFRLKNGSLRGMTYYPDEAVFAADRHVVGGTDVLVKSISVIPDQNGDRDELWLIVERTINGVTRKYVEYMTRYYEDDIAKQNYISMDSALVYNGSATATVTGLDHLEGETVSVMVDGNSHPSLTVSSGSITLSNDVTGSVINIGLPTSWAFKSQKIEAGASDGVAQGKTKRITGIVIRLLNSLGLKYGPSSSVLDEYDFNQGDGFDTGTDLFTGDTPFLRWPGGYEQDGYVYLTHDGVFPVTILSYMPILVTQDR